MSDGLLKKLKRIYKNIVFWIKFSLGALLFRLGLFFNRLSGVKGKPLDLERPKRNYISIFAFNFNLEEARRDCLEIAIGRIGTKGDIYIIPVLGKQYSIHESFHSPKGEKQGEYHIVERGAKIKEKDLAFGDRDFTTAFRFRTFMRMPFCFCFQGGKGLTKEEIEHIVEKLMRYVYLAPSDKEKIVSSLITTGKSQFHLSSEAQKKLFGLLQEVANK